MQQTMAATLHNVCAVHWGMCSTPGDFSTLEDIMSTVGDTMSTPGMFTTPGGLSTGSYEDIFYMLYMPENLYPQLPSALSMSQESFNIEMVRKYYQDIANLKEKYNEKQQKYKNAYNRLLHASTAVSSVAVVSGVSTIRTAFTIVGLPISASLGIVSTVSTCLGSCMLLTLKSTRRSY